MSEKEEKPKTLDLDKTAIFGELAGFKQGCTKMLDRLAESQKYDWYPTLSGFNMVLHDGLAEDGKHKTISMGLCARYVDSLSFWKSRPEFEEYRQKAIGILGSSLKAALQTAERELAYLLCDIAPDLADQLKNEYYDATYKRLIKGLEQDKQEREKEKSDG